MISFSSAQPIIRRKQEALDYQDRQGLWQFELAVRDRTLLSKFYTRIDQVFVIWGLISATIFFTAQFAPISWISQAIFWSVLTIIGTVSMTALTHFWVKVERLRWVLYAWIILMLAGVVVTDLGIFLGLGTILMYLCHLWLALCAVGYFFTGWGLRSRALTISGIIHLLGILALPYCMGWQFFATGIIMTVSLLVFAETQWDMRSPIDNYALLSEAQQEFNRQQYLIRKAEG
ncbi:hypothetical protein [Myxosarcina sp. GI1]|uniref:hypothetical protein n=1 Tax=Myxosarcina sp. GI1 TaxID=1541065 RepID=UPI00056C2B30|nr:hypothetical protein [Myxosarcina sp. GI1]